MKSLYEASLKRKFKDIPKLISPGEEKRNKRDKKVLKIYHKLEETGALKIAIEQAIIEKMGVSRSTIQRIMARHQKEKQQP
ncbi:hypothetical protein [Spirosoma jeollabukense]